MINGYQNLSAMARKFQLLCLPSTELSFSIRAVKQLKVTQKSPHIRFSVGEKKHFTHPSYRDIFHIPVSKLHPGRPQVPSEAIHVTRQLSKAHCLASSFLLPLCLRSNCHHRTEHPSQRQGSQGRTGDGLAQISCTIPEYAI